MTTQYDLIPISDISPNPYQPRLHFSQEELEELAASIQKNGLIQPIIVRKSPIYGYELVAGERRFRAARLTKLSHIPAIIKEISDQESMTQAIVENLQRSNLNPIEEAKAYRQLIDKSQLTHEDIAQTMGKSRPYITNSLRLLNLTPPIQTYIEEGKISQGHARLILGIKDEKLQEIWCQKIIQEEISVRQLEQALKKSSSAKKTQKKASIFFKEQEAKLKQALGLAVSIQEKGTEKGIISIPFDNQEEFHKILHSFNLPVDSEEA